MKEPKTVHAHPIPRRDSYLLSVAVIASTSAVSTAPPAFESICTQPTPSDAFTKITSPTFKKDDAVLKYYSLIITYYTRDIITLLYSSPLILN